MKNEDILEAARKRISEAYTADMPNREHALSDMEFLIGKQWPEHIKQKRETAGKPVLTINKLPQYVRMVTAQIRSMNPSIRVSPADSEATKEVAEIKQGLIRQIEYQCDAPSVYEAAGESAAACGIGNFRILADYCDPYSFDQELKIERIPNPFAVFWDPFAKEPTRKDATYCFIVEDIEEEAFKEAYPDAETTDLTSHHNTQGRFSWSRGDKVTVAEYFWVEDRQITIAQTPDGQIFEITGEAPLGARTRKSSKRVIMWAKVTGSEVLEGPIEIPGEYIPVVAVTGEEWHLGETMYRSSVIRYAKDPAQLYNFARTANAEVVALQPKAPFILTTKQIKGHEDLWRRANQADLPYLTYNPDAEAGGRPARETPPMASSGLMNEAQLASDDMKTTTGIYDASLGARSNETSGVAIQARKQESQNSTSIYADNMVKAVTHTGRILLGMIPKIYDANRVIRILGEDDQEKMVAINQLFETESGFAIQNDMSAGKYGVRVSVGPSYSTKRQESADNMMQFMAAVPMAQQVAADLVAGAQDWPDADRIAERLRKALPPGVADQEEEPTEDQIMQQQQAAQEQEAQLHAQAQMQEIAMQEAAAKAAKAEADAAKAAAEAEMKQLELAIMRGQVSGAIAPQQPGLTPMGQEAY